MCITLLCSYVYPTYREVEQKESDLRSRLSENQELVKKLEARKKTQNERAELESQIQSLRGAVPKDPALDLLVLDLEKLCRDCHLDLVSVERPDSEVLSHIKASEEQMQKMTDENAGKLSIGAKSLATNERNAKKLPVDTAQTTLKQLPKEVFVTGSYENFIMLMRKLERYQRVIGISDVSIALATQLSEAKAPAAEKANRLKLNQPVMSFLMTVYYLP
jgi:Tfp pilus assembly protein PilO